MNLLHQAEIIATLRSERERLRWLELGAVAATLAEVPKGRMKDTLRELSALISENSPPIQTRTLQKYRSTWDSLPEELRGVLDSSKAMLIADYASELTAAQMVELAHDAAFASWGELRERLEALTDKPTRGDVAAVTVRRAVRSAVRRLPADVADKPAERMTTKDIVAVHDAIDAELGEAATKEGVG